MSQRALDVVVAGGGLGGLAGAIRLASLGHRVRLYEQGPALGGKVQEVKRGGYRFDTGPSLVTMPFVLEDLFTDAGRDLADYLELVPVEPVCRYFWQDGGRMDASAIFKEMVRQIHELSERDARAYPRYFEYARRLYETTADVFLFTPFQELSRLLRRRHLPLLLKLHRLDALRTVHGRVSSFFKDPRVRQLFDRYATYNGSDPYRAPATLNVIPYVEYHFGAHYVRGGIYRLVERLATLAEELGVELATETPVEKILHRRGRVTSVLVDGAEQDCDAVLCNADVVHAFSSLIDGYRWTRWNLRRLEPSMSGLVFLWGVKGRRGDLVHHNIFFSADYRAEFRRIFRDLQAPEDPTIYVAITSRADEGDAPEGAENWFVLLNMPYLAPGQDWGEIVPRVRELVLARLKQEGHDIEGKIEEEEVIAPPDFEARFGANRGSIYGLASNSRATAFRRPPNRSRALRGLYFAGGSVHPGGGIPLVVQSGRMAAELLNEHETGRG